MIGDWHRKGCRWHWKLDIGLARTTVKTFYFYNFSENFLLWWRERKDIKFRLWWITTSLCQESANFCSSDLQFRSLNLEYLVSKIEVADSHPVFILEEYLVDLALCSVMGNFKSFGGNAYSQSALINLVEWVVCFPYFYFQSAKGSLFD